MVERNPFGDRTVERTRTDASPCHSCHAAPAFAAGAQTEVHFDSAERLSIEGRRRTHPRIRRRPLSLPYAPSTRSLSAVGSIRAGWRLDEIDARLEEGSRESSCRSRDGDTDDRMVRRVWERS